MAQSGIDAACENTERELNREINLIERDLRELLERITAPQRHMRMWYALQGIKRSQPAAVAGLAHTLFEGIDGSINSAIGIAARKLAE